MKALFFRQKGAAEKVLEFADINMADLLPGEVRVKLMASPINPADFMFIEKTYRVEPVYPQIAGFEGAGIITDNGGDGRYPINALVAFRHKNVWAEYANVPKNKIIRLPQDMPIEKAAQIALNPLTAWALLEEVNASAGEWILLTAGNSAVSKLIIQLAKSRNVKALAIVRGEADQNSLIELGASAVLNVHAEDLEEQIKAVTAGERIAGLLDAVGGELATKLLKLMGVYGKIIHYGLYSQQPVMYNNADIIFKNLVIKGFGIDAWLKSKTDAQQQTIWNELIMEVKRPDFIMGVAAKYSLDDYLIAMAEGKSGKRGKLLFWMS
jgi:NADPH:quinone reductase-like Zn-dependent oxidoreductase